jgi:hypothetical protein
MKAKETIIYPADNSEKIFKVNGDWQIQKNQLKSKFPFLTDGDLQMEVGKENEMLKKVESRLHLKRDEVIAIIEENAAEN